MGKQQQQQTDAQSHGEVAGSSELWRLLDAPISATEASTRAEVDIQIATAKRWPRDVRRCIQDATAMATVNQQVAEDCYYSLPRGNKMVSGPNIRLAEIMVSCWGNIRVGARIIDQGEGFVITEGRCHDLEKNIATTVEARTRVTKKRGAKAPDDDDIQLACARGLAIAVRNAIFKVIPGAVYKPVYQAAMQVASGGQQPIETKRANIAEYFARFGVDEPRLCAALGVSSMDEIGDDEIAVARGIKTAIIDRETTIEAVFPQTYGDGAATKTGALAQSLKKSKGDKGGGKPAGDPEPSEAPESKGPPDTDAEFVDGLDLPETPEAAKSKA